MIKVVFIAGIYGIGKSTVGEQLTGRLGLPCYEASALITKRSGEAYGARKDVSDKDRNQDLLAEEVDEILKTHGAILLTGHFAIFDKARRVVELPSGVFDKLHLSHIVLLESDITKAVAHLKGRDGKEYTYEELSALAEKERDLAQTTARRLGIEIFTHEMNYSSDAAEIAQAISGTAGGCK